MLFTVLPVPFAKEEHNKHEPVEFFIEILGSQSQLKFKGLKIYGD